MVHRVGEGALFVPRNLIQPWLSKVAQNCGGKVQAERISFLSSYCLLRVSYASLAPPAAWHRALLCEASSAPGASGNSLQLAWLLFVPLGKVWCLNLGYVLKLFPERGFS